MEVEEEVEGWSCTSAQVVMHQTPSAMAQGSPGYDIQSLSFPDCNRNGADISTTEQ